ncbi:hypothetical protein [[Limnothrix rosea] IAM M-220]|uniref:hypothetical protein n=1 Tax=[Limnothrix rosea] IAM M-220 TaxID=454133 RepID=UPI00095A6B64|nr:hypothetical protein [[Limnothrix rosea] IAM M-220]OKH19614.1 hypothetical protein NIES208_01495 [[Limnothrix rosea] IAM M-220]
MKPIKPVEMFLALGLAASLGACGTPTPEVSGGAEGDEAATTEEVKEKDQSGHSHGGEGGEGGEGAASGNPDIDYMTALGLMKGHLMVAEELVAAGEFEQSEPHIGHPVEEIYGDIEDELPERGVEDFKDTLNAAHDIVKTSPESPELVTSLDASIAAVDGAIAQLGDEYLGEPEFVMDVVKNLLVVAGEEYAASIADGVFVEAVEYQDSRGFVMYGEMLFEKVAGDLDADASAAIATAFTDLKTAWPAPMPPETPVKTPQEVLNLIVEIESNL